MTHPVSVLGRAALELHDTGLTVMPLRMREKTPLLPTWRKLERPGRSWVQGWWTRWPQANIGIVTGASGLVVIDIDGPAGDASWAALAARHGATLTLTATTGRGRHLYFRRPARHVPNSAGTIGAGIDVRGTVPAYVVAPPSVHPSGTVYAWTGWTGQPSVLPGWLEDLCSPPPVVVQPLDTSSLRAASAYGWKALCDEVQRVLDATEGTRNDTLTRAAFRMGQLVAGGALDRADALSGLTAAGEAVGLTLLEVHRTVGRCLDAGSTNPRSVAA